MMKILNRLHLPRWLEILLGTVLLLRIPSFFEPFTYGDEMIYLTLGEGIRRGLVLYRDIHDNKPPFLYFLAAFAGNVFWFKVILAIWSILTIVLFWQLTKKFFKNERLQKIATVAFALLTTLPLLEGNIANAENFMIGLTIAGFLLALSDKLTFRKNFLAGVMFGLATLFKVPAAFEVPVVLVFWFLGRKSFKELIRSAAILTLGFLTPIGASFVWYYLRGGLAEYFVAAFSQNVGYLSSWRPGVARASFLVRNGPLLVRGLLLSVALVVVYLRRKKLSRPFLFAAIWLGFSLFAVTLSERPYPHYFLQAVGSLSFFIALLIGAKTFEQTLTLLPLFVAVAVPVIYQFYYYPTFAYYRRFAAFATGRIDKWQYFGRFDGSVARNYRLADFITKTTKREELIFVLGDSPPIYALTRRLPPVKYIAGYHLNDFYSSEKLVGDLKKNPPIYIIILPDQKVEARLADLLSQSYLRVAEFDGAEVYKYIKPEVMAHLR